jgi:hypothetical protein
MNMHPIIALATALYTATPYLHTEAFSGWR